MKYIFALIITLISCSTFAQQKPDDALLLDYYQSQRFAEAADYLKSVYPEPVTDMKALSALAYSSSMAGRLPDAEGYYQRIYQRDSTNKGVLFNLGNLSLRRGSSKKAIGYFQKIISLDSTNFAVYKQLATLSQVQGDIAGAIVNFQKANKLNPVEPDVAFDLSTYYIDLKFYEKAAHVLDTAFNADTSNLLLAKGEAQVKYMLKKYPETIGICQKLIANGERSNGVITWMAISQFILKKYQDCINTFGLMNENHTQNETSWYYTAMAYKELHQQKMAVTCLENAVKEGLSPNINSYYAEMGDSYQQLHLLNKAVIAYQKSLFFEEKPLVYYSLANLYDSDLKNKTLAKKYYKKYLATKPPIAEQKNYIAYSKSRIAALNH